MDSLCHGAMENGQAIAFQLSHRCVRPCLFHQLSPRDTVPASCSRRAVAWKLHGYGHPVILSTARKGRNLPEKPKQKGPWETFTGRKGKAKKKKTRSETVSSVLEALSSIPDVDAAMKPWEGKLNPKEQATVLSEQSCLDRARSLFGWIKKQENYAANVYLYNIMLRITGRASQWVLVAELWQEMQGEKIPPNNVTYSTLIDACGKAGRKDEALEWNRVMREHGLVPDEVTMNTIVNLYKRFGEFGQAEAVFHQWLQRSDISALDNADKLVDAPRNSRLSQENWLTESNAFNLPQTIDTFNTLIDLYGRIGRMADACHLFEKMSALGVKPNRVSFNTMMHLCKSHGRFDQIELLLKMMEKASLAPDLATYNILLSVYTEKGDSPAVEEMFTKLKQSGISPDQVTFRTLLSFFTSNLAVVEAERIFEEMETAGFNSDAHALVCMIRMYLKLDMPTTAEEFRTRLNRLPDLSCEHYAMLINSYGEARLWCVAEELFIRYRAGSSMGSHVFVFNVMIKAYGFGKMYEKALSMFKDMEVNDRVKPDEATYNSMTQMFAMAGLVEDGLWFLCRMRELGLMPAQSSVCAVIVALGEAGDVPKAQECFREMQAARVSLDVAAYGAMVNVFSNAGLLEEAEGTIDTMKRAGLVPNCIIYGSLLKLYRKLHMAERIPGLLKEMRAADDKCPDTFAWNCMIEYYGETGSITDAEKCYRRMLDENRADEVTFVTMLTVYKEAGMVKEALDTAKEFMSFSSLSNPSSYNKLIGLYIETGWTREALDVFKKMTSSGVLPNMSTCNLLGEVLENPGLLREAVEQLCIASASGLPNTLPKLAALTSLYALADLRDEALVMCRRIQAGRFKLNVFAYNAIIYTVGLSGRLDEALKHFMTIQSDGHTPNTVTYTSMVLTYRKAGLVEGVTRMLKRMRREGFVPDKVTFKAVIEMYRSVGKMELAAMVMQEMQFECFLLERHMANHSIERWPS